MEPAPIGAGPAPELVATPGQIGMTVTWTVPDTGEVVTGYELRWSRVADPSWTEVRGIASTQTTYAVTGLDADTAYQVQVRALFAGKEGAWSQLTTVWTSELSTPPQTATPPQPATRVGPALSPGPRTPNSVTVTWTAPDTGQVVTGYELRWRRAADPSWTTIRDIASTERTHTIPDLDAGTAYQAQVGAVLAGEEREWSHAITVETAAPSGLDRPSPQTTLGAPIVYQITSTSTGVTAYWLPVTDGAITGFELQWRSDAATTWTRVTGISPTATTHTIAGLEPDTGYTVRVRVVAGSVVGAWWTFQTGTTSAPLQDPAFSVAWENAGYDEGDGEMAFILSTSDEVPEAVTVLVFVVDSAATLVRPGGYSVPVGVVNVGGTEVRVPVALEADTVDEPDSVVFATLIIGDGYVLGTPATATAVVRDDD